MNYSDKAVGELKKYLPYTKCLFVTATAIETETLHEAITPIEGENILRVFHKNQTYYIGKLGNYLIVHVQCSMGSLATAGSTITVSSSIDLWKPNAVIMVGIAFGKDETKQNIADVLVSETIIPYNVQRVGAKQTVFRGPIPPAGPLLLNRFKNGLSNWKFDSGTIKSKVIFGQLLSGESLVDNLEYRKTLISTHPQAIGGEMEGVGVYAASADQKVEWLVVKGICDFADGNKDDDKDLFQKSAASTAVSVCQHICSINNVFEGLQIPEFISFDELACNNSGNSDINKILFDVYTSEKEDYYFVREVDDRVLGYLEAYSIWITGVSGCGKTTLLLRNLDISKRRFTLLNFAHCVGFDVLQLFNELYSKLKDILDPNGKTETFTQIHKLIEAISNLIKSSNQEQFCIFIEEIPLPEKEESLKDFISQLNALLILHRSKNPSSDLRVLLTSIDSPVKYINKYQTKIHERFKFINEVFWTPELIKGFFETLTKDLNLRFDKSQTNEILLTSKGSPRFIKNFIRDYILSKCNSKLDFDNLLKSVAQDLNLYD